MRPTLTKIDGLPSWVPDYSAILCPDPLHIRGVQRDWNAAGPLKWRPDTGNVNSRFLEVQGMCIGSIEDVSDVFLQQSGLR
jgi:hypothetical protein